MAEVAPSVEVLKMALDELRAGYLEVIKIRSKGGWIRVAVSVNAYWYQELCNRHLGRSRRFPKLRTIIKRRHVVRTLEKMIAGKCETVYACRISEIISGVYSNEYANKSNRA